MEFGTEEHRIWEQYMLEQEAECKHCGGYVSGFDVNGWKDAEGSYSLCPKCHKFEMENPEYWDSQHGLIKLEKII